MAVPIAFTSDHIETLYEIDKEYGAEAQKAGLQVRASLCAAREPARSLAATEVYTCSLPQRRPRHCGCNGAHRA